jgi:hypothetical protein
METYDIIEYPIDFGAYRYDDHNNLNIRKTEN